MLQRFAWLYPKYYQRMEDFVEAYVQPINPDWFPNGHRLLREVARLKSRGSHGKAQDQVRRARNRAAYATEPMDRIDGRYRTIVQRVLEDTADWSHIQGAIHYRAGLGMNDVEGESLALDFAEDRGDGWFSIDAGHGFKAGTTWFFGVGSSRKLELTTELIGQPGDEHQGRDEQEPEDGIVGHGYSSFEPYTTSSLEHMAKTITGILAERAGDHDDCD